MTDATFEEWSELQAAWQDRPDQQAAQSAKLRAWVEREQRRERREILAEGVLALLCTAAFVWWALAESGARQAVLFGLAGLAVAITTGSVLLRRRAWAAAGETAAAYRQSLRRRARLGLGFAWLGMIGGPVGVLCGLVIGRNVEGAPAVTASAANLAIGVVGLAVVAAGWIWSFAEARRLKAVLRALEDAET